MIQSAEEEAEEGTPPAYQLWRLLLVCCESLFAAQYCMLDMVRHACGAAKRTHALSPVVLRKHATL